MGWLITLGIVLLFALIIGAMWLGWWSRQRRQRELPPPAALPNDLGAPLLVVERAHYVATSEAENTLERISVRPLAYRGRATIEIHDSGIAMGIDGERPFFIARPAILGARHASYTIDRAVEPGGLIAIAWQLGEEIEVESFLRIVDPAERQRVFETLNQTFSLSEPTREEHK